MRDFPYETCLSTLIEAHRGELSVHPMATSADSRTSLLILVGRIVHQGSPDTKHQMLQAIRSLHQGGDGGERQSFVSLSGSRGRGFHEPQPASVNPGLYSVAVNNHGIQFGLKPIYSKEPVPTEPILWKTILSFKGQTFEGTGTSYKQAQHEAARQACMYFNLRIV